MKAERKPIRKICSYELDYLHDFMHKAFATFLPFVIIENRAK